MQNKDREINEIRRESTFEIGQLRNKMKELENLIN
jgi:hypothetical protein